MLHCLQNSLYVISQLIDNKIPPVGVSWDVSVHLNKLLCRTCGLFLMRINLSDIFLDQTYSNRVWKIISRDKLYTCFNRRCELLLLGPSLLNSINLDCHTLLIIGNLFKSVKIFRNWFLCDIYFHDVNIFKY